MNNYIRILTLFFNNEIAPHEIVLFRGAIISLLPPPTESHNTLFHNHLEDSFRFKYPLIQYKRIRGKATIVCLQEGCDEISKILPKCNTPLLLGENPISLEINKIVPQRIKLQTWNDLYTYQIQRWLPLNPSNYTTYMLLEGVAEKIVFLEKILTANILSFAKGIDITINKNIECKIINIQEPYLITYKNTKLMAFNLEFKTNVYLPNFIGLGKSSSVGNGIVTAKQEK